jgi:hypothetical protein
MHAHDARALIVIVNLICLSLYGVWRVRLCDYLGVLLGTN